MFMAKREEEDKLTVKLTLFKENLQPKKRQQRGGATSVAATVANDGSTVAGELLREPTISIVPVEYSSTVVRGTRLLNKESSVTSAKILLRRHAHVPKRNGNSHEFFKAIYQAKMQDILYCLHVVSIRSVDPEDGKTPLMAALQISSDKQRREVFDYLARHGATYTGRDTQFKRDLIGWAAVLGRHEQLRVILEDTSEEPDFQRLDAVGFTCLHLAVMSGSLPTVDVVLDAMKQLGVGTELFDASGMTPYLLARKLGRSRIAQLLVDKGKAWQHRRDPISFRSPREWSALGRQERLLQKQLLLQQGNFGVMPLTEEELPDSANPEPLPAMQRGETYAEMVMQSLAPQPRTNCQQMLHSAMDVWSEQHRPNYRSGIPLPKFGAVAEAAAKKQPPSSLAHRQRHPRRAKAAK